MADDITKYDDVLTSILVNEKSILGFLSSIFNFLARRTDFYYITQGPHENIGFPPGVAEDLVVNILRSCDPKNRNALNGTKQPTDNIDVNNEIMCSTVAQEVEVIADDNTMNDELCESTGSMQLNASKEAQECDPVTSQCTERAKLQTCEIENKFHEGTSKIISDQRKACEMPYSDVSTPPVIPVQKNNEAYNGAVREKYTWSQTIMELDVIVNLPPNTKAKDLKVTINPEDICVAFCNGDILIKDSLPYKIKTSNSFWSVSENRLLLHLDKAQERWWNKLFQEEEPIDLSKIDCSRPLDELPEDHIAKVRELQWNQERKRQNLPTSDEIRNMEILKRAWNIEGSPFKGTEFNPNLFNH